MNIKKIVIAAVVLLFPFMVWGQAQIDTKKVKISDFTQKVTKVVLTGYPLHDGCLKSDFAAKWSASPFEFCTREEYESLKSSDAYYFFLTTKGQFASAESPSGREYVFLQPILDIIQKYALDAMENDINAYTGLPNYSMNIGKSGDMTLVFSEDDLASEVTPDVKNACFDENVLVLPEEEADEYVSPSKANTLVSYVVAPSEAKPGSFCYKMLIDPQTNTLYYFRKHKISKKFGAGFLAEDVKRIAVPRKK